MAMDWVEEKISFSFDDNWHTVKWDDERAYRDGLCGVTGCRAVDFCAVRERALYLIEIKDFRGHRIENKHRLTDASSDTLADELAHKVCDTVAGLVGAHRSRPGEDALWKPLAEALANRNIELRVPQLDESTRYTWDDGTRDEVLARPPARPHPRVEGGARRP